MSDDEDLGDEPPFNPFAPPDDAPEAEGDIEGAVGTGEGASAARGSGENLKGRARPFWPPWLTRAWATWATFEMVETDPSLPLEELRYRKWCVHSTRG